MANAGTRDHDFTMVIKAKTHAHAGVNTFTFTPDGYCKIAYGQWQVANGMMKKDFDLLKSKLESYPNQITMDITTAPYIKVDMQVCDTDLYKDMLAEVKKAATGIQR